MRPTRVTPAFTSAFAIFLSSLPLLGQAASPWRPLVNRPQEQVVIMFRATLESGRYLLEFKNRGGQAVHFQFQVIQLQDRDQGIRNGRIHLRPDSGSGRIIVPNPDPSHPLPPTCNLQVINLRAGAKDVGPFLPY